MKAAIVRGAGQSPVYGEMEEPQAREGYEVVTVSAAALTHLTKARASGAHYSAAGSYPNVPGVDGVGRTADGRRVYFALPDAKFGAMAQKTLVRREQCIPVPDNLDDVTAAAIANPGMSVGAALLERAKFQPGETVLIHGATGSAGTVAVQYAKFLGAGKIIATGRNPVELERVKSLGADVVIPVTADLDAFEQALTAEFSKGVDIVIDYLWGEGARRILSAAAKAGPDGRAVRFVQVGSAAGQESIDLPASALRSSSLELMGSGLKSVSIDGLLRAIAKVFEAASQGKIQITAKAVPLADVETAWNADDRARIVFTL